SELDLGVVDVTTGATSTLYTATAPYGEIFSPHYSHDGTRIMFSMHSFSDGSNALCMIDASGGSPTFLTSGSDGCWSPDDNQVFYRITGISGGFLLDLQTGASHQVSPTQSIRGYPIDWEASPCGGDAVLFLDLLHSPYRLVMLD